jgi:hypothetical protein
LRAIDSEYVDLHSGEVTLPFSLWSSEGATDCVRPVLSSDPGLQGVLEKHTEAAMEWAIEEYERVRERADQITHPPHDESPS